MTATSLGYKEAAHDFYTETVVAEYDWQLKCARDPRALHDLKEEWGMRCD